MKKLAHGGGKVYVILSPQEFTMLTDQVPSNVPAETVISLAAVKQKLNFMDDKKPQLAELKVDLVSAVKKLNQIGV